MEEYLKRLIECLTGAEPNVTLAHLLMHGLVELDSDAKRIAEDVAKNPDLAGFYRGYWNGRIDTYRWISDMLGGKVPQLLVAVGRDARGYLNDTGQSVKLRALFDQAVKDIENHRFPPEIKEVEENKD